MWLKLRFKCLLHSAALKLVLSACSAPCAACACCEYLSVRTRRAPSGRAGAVRHGVRVQFGLAYGVQLSVRVCGAA
eukprot:2425260-Pleurochrysis_carterae.AAC.2